MREDMDVYGRLESPLYGGLLLVLDTLSRKIEADTAAARVFGLAEAPIDCCVVAARLKLARHLEAALDRWPHDEGCLFDRLHRAPPAPGVFRPRDYLDEAEYAGRSHFMQLESTHHVVDCLCEWVELAGPVRVMFCYVRCAPNLPFLEEHAAVVRQFQPNTHRIMQGALRSELRPLNAAATLVAHTMPLSRVLSRLSRTERQVLSYLRTSLTESQIADEMSRSPHTVHVHVKNIYRKLGVTSRKQLMELFMDR